MATIIVSDTFTNAETLPLTAHTPDIGTGWTEEENTTVGLILEVESINDNVIANGSEASARIIATAQPNSSITNSLIQCTVTVIDISDNTFHIIARLTDTSNYYGAQINPSGFKRIYKNVAGVKTSLITATTSLSNGDVFVFESYDGTKRLLQNGVEELKTTDNELISSGRGGIGFGNIFIATHDVGSGWQIDNFSITESRHTNLSMMGIG